jgi:hypothetical protein
LRALPHPWHPCCPDLPRHPAGPRGERAREPWSTTRSSLNIPSRVLSAQTQPCWPSAAADPLRCDRVDQVLAGDIAPPTAWLRAWPEAPQPARSTPWWRSRSCANERRYSAYTTSIPALALVCSFIKQATANVRSLPMVAAVAHCRATSIRAAGFLKATCLGQPLCVEPDAICEIRSTHDAPPPAHAPTWPLDGQ